MYSHFRGQGQARAGCLDATAELSPAGRRAPRYTESVGRFDSLLEKAKEKRKELVRRAASKAASAALEGTTRAAVGAVDSVSNAIEKAIFGDVLKSKDDPASGDERDARNTPEVPDPFARLKEKERAEALAAESARARAQAKTKLDEDVDAELSALKKKLGK